MLAGWQNRIIREHETAVNTHVRIGQFDNGGQQFFSTQLRDWSN